MRNTLTAQIQNIIFGLIIAITALTPLFFTTYTTEYFETPKIILLIVVTFVLLVLWSLSWVLQGKVVVTRTPFDIPLLLLLAVVIISTFLSDSRWVSIYGNFPRIHGSTISWVAYILFFFVLASNIKTVNHVKILIYTLLGSATVMAIFSIAAYFVPSAMPLAFMKLQNFTPAGSSFSAASLLALLLPVLVFSITHPNRFLTQPLSALIMIIFTVTIALVGNPLTQFIAAASIITVLVLSKKEELKKNMVFWLIPVIVSALVLGLGFVPFGNKNPLSGKKASFPQEIQLPFADSWKISASVFRDAPFFGTGPSTYLFNFTQYKPIDLNSTNLWNFRFDSAYNEFLQILGTLGTLGILAFIFFLILILNFSWKSLKDRHNNFLSSALGLSLLVFILLLAIHNSTPVLIIAALILVACMIAINKTSGKVEELSLGIKASKLKDVPMFGGNQMDNIIVGDILPVILFIPIVILIIIGFWHSYSAVAADVYHRMALNAATSRGLDTYNYLIKSEQLNPRIDLYRIDLAQTNFALANAIAASKAPTESSPSGALTDQDKANIQQLLSQSINEGKIAIALSPRSAQNWEVLASIYRQISGVAENALQFSVDAYNRALQLDPYNPLLRLNIGGVYYSAQNYDLAIRFFDDAVKLKPDYANAYYNLSVALRDKGNLQEAQLVAERVVALLQNDTNNPDYKTASEFLTDLKARIATGSAETAGGQPPAAAQNSALQQQELPDVNINDLNSPQNVATAPAVKR